jgi:hypothetical protein
VRSFPSYRYRCDFCGKTSGSGGHMARHERGCTANPGRICGVCDGRQLQRALPDLIAALGKGDEAGVVALREAAGGCPACMLAAVRQSGLQHGPDEEGPGFSVPWKFSEEKDAWWREQNERDLVEEMRG